MAEEKLILDQPERVTPKGTVENVVVLDKPTAQKLNDDVVPPQTPEKQNEDTLLNDDPMAGVEIILS